MSEKEKFDKKAYDREYHKNKYKRIPFDVTFNFAEMIDNHIKITKESRNAFIKRAIIETIENDKKNI